MIPSCTQEACFLCLEQKKNDEEFVKTTCCQTTVHDKCIQDRQVCTITSTFRIRIGMWATNVVRVPLDRRIKT